MRTKPVSTIVLIFGDFAVILLVVLLGFSFHNADAAARLKFTFLPFLGSWLLAAWALALYSSFATQWNGLWRGLPAMLLAAPLGGVWRAAWLGSPALPIFIFVLGSLLALALLLWRAVFTLLANRLWVT